MTAVKKLVRLVAAVSLAALSGCSKSPANLQGVTPANHRFFQVASGSHAVDCTSCHTNGATFSQFSCTGCHAHDRAPTDLVHAQVASYAFASPQCYACHATPSATPYSHAGITSGCATCHAVGASFAALPKAGFTHQDVRGADCSGCHDTKSWAGAGGAPSALVHDPARDVKLTALVPSYAGTSISAVTPRAEDLPQSMDHASAAIDAATLSSCASCHASASAGSYYPGVFHASLADLGKPQPASCADCHVGSMPAGFVGAAPARPARTPSSGEMKHDAVEWVNGAPTTTAVVTTECSVCHASPTAAVAASWATGRTGTGAVAFHASLAAAARPQPASCLDCHASSRPVAVLTSGAAALPAGIAFDHGEAEAIGDCAGCHAASAAGGFGAWSGARFHLAGAATPSTCLPCHEGERPASTAGWRSATYAASPFDYGTNAAGIGHGNGQDCVTCHAGPGTGAWGGTQNWVGGRFAHGPGTTSDTTCIACHSSQRPDLQPGTTAAAMATLLGFDHAVNGRGDCIGCHQATVSAGRYVDYVNPSTRALPGGDWKGGAFYPGSAPVSAPAVVTVTSLTLVRSGSLVTGMTSTSATLYGSMVHTSAAIPAAVRPGPGTSPDMTTCWHCHTSTNGTVTSYAGGAFHAALARYQATPGGPVQPLPQPTSNCGDCHANMRPAGIVEKAGSALQPFDHAAAFTGTVTIGGTTVTSVAGLDCSVCHKRPGDTWSDGTFHASTGSARPADCTVCHYPLMATASADVTSGNLYAMAHRSPQVTVQRCDQCHATALGQSTGTPLSAAQWRTGAFHASVAAQPTGCSACHAVSTPTGPTQSSVVYTLTQGGTGNNAAQWMSHASSAVVGQDCAVCHAADAKASGAAWSKSTAFHARVPAPGSCQACHGLGNGGGSVPGTGNNLPVGLIDSATLTTAASDPATGVPAGTHDQIVHTDLNVSGHDCSFCHTQAGPSTVAGVQGREWAQARMHASFSAAAPLVTNGTTGRCSDCHLNVKPGATFTAQDHSQLTSASGTQDCVACHVWPGTGTAAAPNWLGGGGAPQFIVVGGFTIPAPPAASPTTQTGIANLPHPSTASTSCATCHTGGVGGKGAKGYDHASTLAATSCNACHEAGSNLVAASWNGATTSTAGAGDTRPFTLTTARATYKGDSQTFTVPNHFFVDRAGVQVECVKCHVNPTGVSVATTGTAYTTAWAFKHPPESPIQNFCYACHPNGRPN